MLPLHDAPLDETKIARRPKATAPRRPSKEIDRRWMTALADPSRVIFLDVETTGLSWFYDELTIVGWAQGTKYNLFVAGDDATQLLDALSAANTLITFNGTLFDLRFLKKTFGEIRLPATHIDLRYLAKRVGLAGGQKIIEKILELPGRVGLEDMDGAAAVLLWHQYVRGDRQALHRLVEYNRHDVLGMHGILDAVLDKLDIHPDLLISRPRFSDAAGLIYKQDLTQTTVRPQTRHFRRPLEFQTIFGRTPAERATVVGIDLTGSESRPSGWCVLRGRKAETRTIATDDEMMSRIIAERPSLVSIDSPLSIPFGRTQVEDSDPGRDQFGIMRRCERELKRRGINVYPCLLPSMQKLTQRGMRLAERCRSAGIPVIESYPGAAQDIMGIPRKGAGVQYLKQGLVEFGVQGSFGSDSVTHDELDAITSALVGSFFLSGQYEGLSGPTEGALIIPDLQAPKSSKIVVGFSGKICAGKTTSAHILEDRGFAYTRFSSVIDDEITARGESPNRATRQRVGNELHQDKGQRWLCEKVLDRVIGSRYIVVDGLRFPEDHAFFFEQFGTSFVHVHVNATSEVRARRYQQNEPDNVPFEIADAQSVESKIDELASLANVILDNMGSMADLERNVQALASGLIERQDGECQSRLS